MKGRGILILWSDVGNRDLSRKRKKDRRDVMIRNIVLVLVALVNIDLDTHVSSIKMLLIPIQISLTSLVTFPL